MIVFDKSVAYEIFLFENDRIIAFTKCQNSQKANSEHKSTKQLCFFTNTLQIEDEHYLCEFFQVMWKHYLPEHSKWNLTVQKSGMRL